jgi:hypothetical protein
LAVVLALAAPACAVEYGLRVANLYHGSFVYYFDGPLGSGSGELVMDRLHRALDADRIPQGVLLSDRTFRYGWDAVAASFRGFKVVADIKPAEGPRRWDEVVWQGAPGERSVLGNRADQHVDPGSRPCGASGGAAWE